MIRFANIIPSIPFSVQMKWTLPLILWNQGFRERKHHML